ncbi:DNA-binding response regulator, NarL/FixJ family, contains REC and HTH domains [Flaviramulus basaltis]|uniref:DNA-binding response regulator, NarL/FixJ family, contains REC and HTH domains n=1 Tax=Flaviramulus basaltis TaxID=369401 RepID=A0A1K2IEL2_9FLAO|nr:response regulator transcription factor [Flaviramulus basaltis]SFZ90728.1 DNA-binding response regulator, NarL/FixJ family, contains REC and HTH domains [Flaviramulus basaltis]
MSIISLLIADDHTIFREGLTSLLEDETKIIIVGEAQNGVEVLELANLNSIDIILMDIEMPIKNGINTTRELKKTYPEIKILALTMHKNASFIKQMLKAGADGYILKDAGKEELIIAIQTIMNGKPYHSTLVTESIMKSIHRQKENKAPLTERELEIIQLISNQFITSQIAEKLHLSPMTIETHRKNIYLKLGVHNAAGLVKLALKNGWIE